MAAWLIVLILALGGLFVLLQSGVAGLDNLPAMPIAAGVIAILMAAYLALSKGSSERPRRWRAVIFAGGLLAAIAAIAAYALTSQAPFKAMMPDAGTTAGVPFTSDRDGPRAVRLRKRDGGQFIAHANVNGAALDLLIDTGASAVVLRHADAEKAGIDTAALTFTTPIETGNGTAYTAPVRIRSITIGPIRVEGIEALVAKPGSVNESLLGMTFLRRLRSYEIAGDFVTLRQ